MKKLVTGLTILFLSTSVFAAGNWPEEETDRLTEGLVMSCKRSPNLKTPFWRGKCVPLAKCEVRWIKKTFNSYRDMAIAKDYEPLLYSRTFAAAQSQCIYELGLYN